MSLDTPHKDIELEEKVEKLFKPKISSSGSTIEVYIGISWLVMPYEDFMDIRDSIMNLITTHTERARLEGVVLGMERAKNSITVTMNTSKATLQDLRSSIDREVKWWNENMLEEALQKGTNHE